MTPLFTNLRSGRLQGGDLIKKRIGNQSQVVANDIVFGAAFNEFLKNLADTFTLTDSITNKETQLSKSDILSLSEVLSKIFTTDKSDGITLADSTVVNRGLFQSLSDTISLIESLGAKDVALTKTEIITLAETISRDYGLPKSDAITLVEIISKEASRSLSDTIQIKSTTGGGGSGYYREITIDNAKVPNTDQTDFPVVFRTLKSVTWCNGGTIYWTSGDKFPSYINGEQILINREVKFREIVVDNAKVPNTDQTDFPTLFRTLKATVDTSGTAVSWVSGDKFRPSFAGQQVLINGAVYTVSTYTNDTTLVLSATAGTQTGVTCLDTPYLRTVANSGQVTNANGHDIQFWADNTLTTKLKWEIEYYSPTTGEIVAHIKKTLTTAVDTRLSMTYGDANIGSFQGDAVNVWNSNYKAVYSLGDGSNAIGDDNSANGFNATLINSPAHIASSPLGYGADFNNVSSQKATSSGINISGGAFSISCWINPNALADASIFQLGTNLTTNEILGLTRIDSTTLKMGMYGDDLSATGLPTLDGTWWYVVIKMTSGKAQSITLNGVQVASRTASLYYQGNTSLEIAHGSDYNTYYSGGISELRFANVHHSDDWDLTEYNNQSDPTTFYSVEAEQIGYYMPTVGTVTSYVSDTQFTWSSNIGDVVGILTNTPYLRTVANGGSVENANGYDIQFFTTSALSTKLKWEILYYNAITGEIISEIKRTLLTASDTSVFMGYGDAAITTFQGDVANTYKAAYKFMAHCGESDPDWPEDVTSNGNTWQMQSQEYLTSTVIGPIYQATDFGAGGMCGYSKTGSTNLSGNFTYKCIFKLNNAPSAWQEMTLMGKAFDLGTPDFTLPYAATRLYIQEQVGDIVLHGVIDDGTTATLVYYNLGTVASVLGKFIWVAFTNDGTNSKLYVNSVLRSTTAETRGAISSSNVYFYLGGNTFGTLGLQNRIDGALAETALLSEALSVDWLATEYNNQKDTATFYSVGTQQSAGGGLVETISKQPGLNKSDTLSLTESLIKDINKGIADVISLLDGINVELNPGALLLNLSDTITLIESRVKEVSMSIAFLVNFSDILNKTIGANKSDILAFSDITSKATDKALNDSLILVSGLSKDMAKALSDTITLSEAISKSPNISKADGISLSDSIRKEVAKALADTLTLLDGITTQLNGGGLTLSINLSDNIALAQTLVKNITRAISDAMGLIDLPSKTIVMSKSDNLTIADLSRKAVESIKADTITLTDLTHKTVSIAKAESIVIQDTISKSLYRTLLDDVLLTEQSSKDFNRTISDTILFGEIISKRTELTISDALTLLDIISPYLSSKLGRLKVWNGSAWVLTKLWVAPNGTFVPATLKLWDGSTWRIVDTTGI